MQTASLTLSEKVYCEICSHLFQGDDKESVGLIICTRHEGKKHTRLLSLGFHPIPIEVCTERTDQTVAWPTSAIASLLAEASDKNYTLVKIHSHPGGYPNFSSMDDQSDRLLFPSLHGWFECPISHASAIMLPDGKVIGRTVDRKGKFTPLSHINIAGDDLEFWPSDNIKRGVPAHAIRIAQAFGEGTYNLFRRLKIGVVGCSGTGNPTVMQLAQNNVGHLVLVDPDIIEQKNLTRLLTGRKIDAENGVLKVDNLKQAIDGLGFGTTVEVYPTNLLSPEAVHAIADCDIIFGCVDSVLGRHILNRISSYYLIPYFDIGVKLIADGKGGVSHICGTSHFIKPGGSSLLSRNVYTLDQLRAEEMKRTDPDSYKNELERGYLKGVNENSPAVGSVNMRASSLAVTDFLARLHGYRLDPNEEYAVQRFELVNGIDEQEGHGEACPVLSRCVGKGDRNLLLDFPALGQLESAA